MTETGPEVDSVHTSHTLGDLELACRRGVVTAQPRLGMWSIITSQSQII